MARDMRKRKSKKPRQLRARWRLHVPLFSEQGKGKATACFSDNATCVVFDNDDDAVEPEDSFQAYSGPAEPSGGDGDDVEHERDDECDTSGSYKAVGTANATEVAKLDAIALFADTWDVDLCRILN